MMSSSRGKLLVFAWLVASATIGVCSFGDLGLELDGPEGVERTASDTAPEHRRELLCGDRSRTLATARIWSGNDARPGEFPYQVNLQALEERSNKWTFKCGGVLISRRFVLTAAHCVQYWYTRLVMKPDKMRATLGGHEMENLQPVGGTLVNIVKVIQHPQYDNNTNINDIALLKLAKPVDYFMSSAGLGSINRVCLPGQPNGVIGNNTKVVLSGWGLLKGGKDPIVLQKADFNITAHSDCVKKWSDAELIAVLDEEKQICALDSKNKKTPDSGDSGSPLIRELEDGRHELLGLLCCTANYDYITKVPQIYTRVSHYLDWILDEAGLSSITDEL